MKQVQESKYTSNIKENKKRRRNLAWLFVAIGLIGVGIGGYAIYKNSDLAYNNEIKSSYFKVINNLEDRIYEITPGSHDWKSRSIEFIRFGKAINNETAIEIISKGLHINGVNLYADTFYKTATKNYNTLLAAEYAEDINAYIAALDECFKNMEFVSQKVSSCSPDLQISKENAEKFNELFNLSTVQTNKDLKQVGFLPQYLQYEGEKLLDDDMKQVTYTIKGLSFVEIAGEEGDGILPGKNSVAIMNNGVDKNKVQMYESNFQFNIKFDPKRSEFDLNNSYVGAFWLFFQGDSRALISNVNVTHFKTLSSDSFAKMQTGTFNFKKKLRNKLYYRIVSSFIVSQGILRAS